MRLTSFIPSFRNRNIVSRIFLSAFLVVLSCAILYSQFGSYASYVNDALTYDPYGHALDLRRQNRLAQASDFIEFYQSIPNVGEHPELDALKSRIDGERSSPWYCASELWNGLTGGESDEDYAEAFAFITDFMAVGDVRALYAETRKYLEGEEVDVLTAGLAAFGVALSAAKLGPQAAALAPVRSTASFFRKSLAAMNRSLKKDVLAAFAPVSDMVARFRKGGIDSLNQDIAAVFRTCSARFGSLLDLAARDRKAAMLVVGCSDDVAQLSRNARLAMDMGGDARGILAHGGRQALEAAGALQKGGRLTGDALKGYMRFGPGGLRAAGKIPLERLAGKVRLFRVATGAKFLHYMELLLSWIPRPAALLIAIGAMLTVLKTWLPLRRGA